MIQSPSTSSDKNIPFLQWVAQHLSQSEPEKWIDTVVVLPSRRACNVIREHLMKNSEGKALILPQLVPIQDFWVQLSGYAVPDNEILLLELFEVYKSHWSEDITFEEFLPWGKMMLSDFDEIDKYGVDAKKLFTIIQDEKEIDQMFSIEEELKEIMSHFWSVARGNKPYEKTFIKTWEVIGKVYQDYTAHLKSMMLAYSGMAYRSYYESIKNAASIDLPYQFIHFVGFNAFAELDVQLIKKLADHRSVFMYWDVDQYFMDHPDHEAGNFLKMYKTLFTGIKHFWNEGNALSVGKKYFLHGAPMHQGQVKVATQLLRNDFSGTTGLVLSEEEVIESLLFDMDRLDQANITMSLPVGDTAVTDWLEILFRLQSQESIHKSDLNRLYKHYYFRMMSTDAQKVDEFKKRILDGGTFFFSKKFLQPWLSHLIPHHQEEIQNLKSLCQFWIQTLENIQKHITNQQDRLHIILPYFIQAIYDREKLLSPYESKISFKAMYQLLLSHLKSISVPFQSDPLRPVQVMGFLESRLMDFDRVIILGANEEILPRSKRGNSYIPYSLRKPFGLPTLKEYDGIYAYHFFRLLQRAKEVHLIYNNAPGELPFERSRFLGQIQLELNSPENQIYSVQWSYPIKVLQDKSATHDHGLVIQKTERHIEILKNREYSQSALSLYLRCPVQFYLRYVAKIVEKKEVEEIMDASTFGNVLHKAMELLYEDLLNQIVTPEIIKAKFSQIDIALKNAFDDNKIPYTELKGKNLLAYDIMQQSVKKILFNDIELAKESPFAIVGLEQKKYRNITLKSGQEIKLYGLIDRIDEVQGTYRIIDYKTGSVKLLHAKKVNNDDLADIFTRHNLKIKPQTFQGMFYQFLINQDDVQIGFYEMKSLSKGIQFLNNGEMIPESARDLFLDQLCQLLEEILDIEKPFVQNPDPLAYNFSPYAFVMN